MNNNFNKLKLYMNLPSLLGTWKYISLYNHSHNFNQGSDSYFFLWYYSIQDNTIPYWMKTEMLFPKHEVSGIPLHIIIYRIKKRQLQTRKSLKILHNMNQLSVYHIQGVLSNCILKTSYIPSYFLHTTHCNLFILNIT